MKKEYQKPEIFMISLLMPERIATEEEFSDDSGDLDASGGYTDSPW